MAIYPQIQRTSGGATGTQINGQMSIVIYDAVTGLPANGNGISVTYQQNINGVVSAPLTVTVLGLSFPIYTGELSDTNSAHPYHTSFTILSFVIPVTPPPPNPAVDDLAMVAIVTTPESAIGASDGTVKIIATSSFGPIQYSLDNSTWFANPLFTGRPGGTGIGYAKDANGGLVSTTYTVDFIGKVLSQDPSIDLGNGNLSRWNAAFNPIWFRFQRQDFEITSVVNGSFSKIKIAVNADLTKVTPRTVTTGSQFIGGSVTASGDLVYIKTANYEGTYEVIEKTSGTLTLDCPFVSTDTVGFVNINSIKLYYQVQIIVTYVDPITGKFATSNMNFSPKGNGLIEADLSALLQSIVVAKDKSDYSLVNYRDAQLSASYTIQYAEVWKDALVSWINITRPYYVLFAAKQLGDNGGGNLVDYVPYPLSFQPAKWLTDFAMPVYAGGFPFDLGFIFSEYMVGTSPFYTVKLLDINKNPLGDQSVPQGNLLKETGDFLLQQDGGKFIIASASLATVPIVEHVGMNRLLINWNIPDLCYYFTIQIHYTLTGTTYNLTKPLTCRIDRETPDRPVYLRWVGLTGSWNYFRFVYNQQISLDVTDAVMVKKFVVDWQNEDTIDEVISKNAGEKMQVFGENISEDDIKGLQSIKYSPKVQILTSGQGVTPPKWQTVVVASGTFSERETYVKAGSFSIVIALPEKNIQTN